MRISILNFGKEKRKKNVQTPNIFVCDTQFIKVYAENLKSSHIEQSVSQIRQSLKENKLDASVSKFNIIFKHLATNTNTKKIRHKDPGKQIQAQSWFDVDCSTKKQHISRLGKQLRQDPTNNAVRDKLNRARKDFKYTIRIKRKNYESKSLKALANSTQDPQKFWRLVKNLKKSKTKCSQPSISNWKWKDHFQSLLQSDREPENLLTSNPSGPIDGPVTNEELQVAKKCLKKNKAAGLDSISYEMLDCILDTYPDLIRELFNNILETGKYPIEWATSLITPIHKKGSTSDPNNYRGISLLPCLSKFFSSILQSRILDWALQKNIFSRGQLGFLPGNRTSDALIILHNLIDKYCHKNGKVIHACFIDFQKAFDTIPRDRLLNKLLKLGLHGKVFQVIKSMYTGDKTRIKVGSAMTDPIDINQGVRQGCILSPLLFNLFLSDFEESLDQFEEYHPKVDATTRIPCILWADDIIILSETKTGLQAQLSALETCCKSNSLTIH